MLTLDTITNPTRLCIGHVLDSYINDENVGPNSKLEAAMCLHGLLLVDGEPRLNLLVEDRHLVDTLLLALWNIERDPTNESNRKFIEVYTSYKNEFDTCIGVIMDAAFRSFQEVCNQDGEEVTEEHREQLYTFKINS
jgi:hypothetical protein